VTNTSLTTLPIIIKGAMGEKGEKTFSSLLEQKELKLFNQGNTF
jgi:hypothetical protein